MFGDRLPISMPVPSVPLALLTSIRLSLDSSSDDAALVAAEVVAADEGVARELER